MGAIEHTILYERGGVTLVVVFAIACIIITAILAYILVRLMYKALSRASGGDIGGSIIANIIRAVLWIICISVICRECFALDTGVLIGALGVGGIALSLGMQNTISNLIGGLQTSFSRDIKIGDWVTVNGLTGRVKDVTWRVMKMMDVDGNEYIIPNSLLTSTPISKLTPWQPVKMTLVFSRKADISQIIEKVPQIAASALEKADFLHKGKDPFVAIDGTSVDAINATLVVYAKYTCNQTHVHDCVMPAVVDYLRSIDALAICGEE